MNNVSDERIRLQERLRELDLEQGHILYALSVLDRIEPSNAASAPNRRPSGRAAEGTRIRAGSTLDHAVRVINESGHSWRAEDLIPVMRGNGWATQVENEVETVRSALSRAVRDGLISRPEHAQYAPRPSEEDLGVFNSAEELLGGAVDETDETQTEGVSDSVAVSGMS